MTNAFQKKAVSGSLACVLAATFLQAAFFAPAGADELRSSISPISQSEPATDKGSWRLRISPPISAVPGSLAESMHPGEAEDGSLADHIYRALLESDELRSTYHEYRASLASKNEALFSLAPTLSFELDSGRTSSIDLAGNRVTNDYGTASLNLNWPVFASGTRLANIQAARFAAAATRYQALNTERKIIADALLIYLELLASSRQVAALEQSRAGLREVLAGTRKQFAAGFASRTDVAQIENELAEIGILLEQARNEVDDQRLRWKSTTSKAAPNKLDWPNLDRLLPATREEVVAKALADNPTVASADFGAKSDFYRSKAEMAGFLPRVEIYGRAERNFETVREQDDENDYRLGARLTVPLVNLAAMSRYKRYKELAFVSRYRAADTKRAIKREVEAAWLGIQSLEKQETLIRERIKTGRQIREGFIKEFKAGLRPVSDYLRQEVELARLEQDLIRNRVSKTSTTWQILLQFDQVSLATLIK